MKSAPLNTSEIQCRICHGTGKHQTAHPSHNAACGACFGSGRSTEPIDQQENWTMVGTGNFGLRFNEWWEDFLLKHPTAKREGCGTRQNDRYIGIPVGFPNPEYTERLERDRKGQLYFTS